jgi:uncharacterized protein DUF5615
MPESLVTALGRLGHQVESVNHLGIKGIADEALYRDVAQTYDLCFTRDVGFTHNVRQKRDPVIVKVLHVILQQQRIEQFLPCSSKRSNNPTGRITRTVPTGPEWIFTSSLE